MAQHNPEEIVYHYRNGSDIPDYYSFREELYCGTFPEGWAIKHHPGTGPHDCASCMHDGFWNGVFIGYCETCARDVYQGERGRGFVSIGKESNNEVYFSAFETYLYELCPDDVGDKDFMDSAKAVNEMSRTDLLERLVSIEIENVYHKLHDCNQSADISPDMIEYSIDRRGNTIPLQ